eukprot:CAMPEP_0204191036 /NCGR_PEP_ID=MMETSP0361-20130328/59787_1 /ASSEMBLY_ACC=CAM_ASM_000343 /TAXON_ID=268821 /ORGANISM="Scrippsiella Hangoei, Strain SHTV-5" /LENGTH=84 /DNA_ID=CAMNT_0051151941 /DNA_START=248 /DNA_END=504 /DNA_ORIENTATION=-
MKLLNSALLFDLISVWPCCAAVKSKEVLSTPETCKVCDLAERIEHEQHGGAHHEDDEEVQARVHLEVTVGAHGLQAAYQADERD